MPCSLLSNVYQIPSQSATELVHIHASVYKNIHYSISDIKHCRISDLPEVSLCQWTYVASYFLNSLYIAYYINHVLLDISKWIAWFYYSQHNFLEGQLQ